MKILINASNIKLGGVLQVTVSFINEISSRTDVDFVLIVNKIVGKEIRDVEFGDNFELHSLNFRHPLQSGYSQYVASLNQILKESRANIAFSVFGPAYWIPEVPHIVGFAYGWAINPDSKFIRTLPILKKMSLYLQNAYKSYYFRNEAQYYIVETEVVKQRLSKQMQFPLSDIYVVSNTYNHYFHHYNGELLPWPVPENGFKMLTIATNYAHKNLKIYKPICEYFRSRGIHDIYFIVTVPDEDYQKLYPGGDPNIINVGKVAPRSCPSLYAISDAMILPTLLEAFSACYPEAMIMKKPILTSDLDFARDICQDSAVYFDPFDFEDVANKILELRANKDLQNRVVQAGLRRVKHFSSARERAQEYMRICLEVAEKTMEVTV